MDNHPDNFPDQVAAMPREELERRYIEAVDLVHECWDMLLEQSWEATNDNR